MKCDVSTFLTKLPVAPIIVETIEALTSAGAISTTKRTTTITSSAGSTAYTLAAGTHGQQKLIACQTMGGGGATAVVTVTGGTGFTTLTFNAAGDFILLENVNGYWFVAGNNSVTVV